MIDRRHFLGGAAIAGGCVALPGWARTRAAQGGWPAVQTLFDSWVAEGKLPGMAAALARGTDEPRFIVAGTLATESARKVDADSLFRVYSMTKPITGIAAMMLVEDGRLRLDQDVADFLPGFAKPMVAIDPEKSLDARPAVGRVTVRGLLTHSAGLGYVITGKGALPKAFRDAGLSGGPLSRLPVPGFPPMTTAPDLTSFADRLSALPLRFDPGTRWSYSAGLDLMGRVIELASGLGFEAFLRQRLFEPLGMTSSFFSVPVPELARMTTNYGIAGGSRIALDPGAMTIFSDPATLPLGGGGLVMSPRDYDRFLLMLAGKGAIGRTRVMKAQTVALALSNLLPPGVVTEGTIVAGQGFGAGGRVTLKPEPGGPGVGTFGWGGAAGTIAWLDPMSGIRASGFVQYMPDTAYPFRTAFAKAVNQRGDAAA